MDLVGAASDLARYALSESRQTTHMDSRELRSAWSAYAGAAALHIALNAAQRAFDGRGALGIHEMRELGAATALSLALLFELDRLHDIPSATSALHTFFGAAGREFNASLASLDEYDDPSQLYSDAGTFLAETLFALGALLEGYALPGVDLERNLVDGALRSPRAYDEAVREFLPNVLRTFPREPVTQKVKRGYGDAARVSVFQALARHSPRTYAQYYSHLGENLLLHATRRFRGKYWNDAASRSAFTEFYEHFLDSISLREAVEEGWAQRAALVVMRALEGMAGDSHIDTDGVDVWRVRVGTPPRTLETLRVELERGTFQGNAEELLEGLLDAASRMLAAGPPIERVRSGEGCAIF